MLMETAVRALASYERPLSPHEIGAPVVAVVGALQAVVGVLLGVTSVGSGSLVILSMVYLFRMTAQQIIGSNIVIALIMVIPARLTHALAAGRAALAAARLAAGRVPWSARWRARGPPCVLPERGPQGHDRRAGAGRRAGRRCCGRA